MSDSIDIKRLLGAWNLHDLRAISPKIAEELVTDLYDAGLALSKSVSHKFFELSKTLDETAKSEADEAADVLVAITMFQLSVSALRQLGFPRGKVLRMAVAEGLIRKDELALIASLPAGGKTRRQRPGAAVGKGRIAASSASSETTAGRTSRRAEVPEARPRKGSKKQQKKGDRR